MRTSCSSVGAGSGSGDAVPGRGRLRAAWVMMTRWAGVRAGAERLARERRWREAWALVETVAEQCPRAREVAAAGWRYARRSDAPVAVSVALERAMGTRALRGEEAALAWEEILCAGRSGWLSRRCLAAGEAACGGSARAAWLLGVVYFVRREPGGARRCWSGAAQALPHWMAPRLLLECLALSRRDEAGAHTLFTALDCLWQEGGAARDRAVGGALARALADHVAPEHPEWAVRIWKGFVTARPGGRVVSGAAPC